MKFIGWIGALATLATGCGAQAATSDFWKPADEVSYYQSAHSGDAKAFVGSALVNAARLECSKIWTPIENRLAGAD